MGLTVVTLIDPLSAELDILAQMAEQEGHPHIRRLVIEWLAGINRFDQPGEKLVGVYDRRMLVGIGGMTTEISRDDWLRMRRFYVSPNHRYQGIGRMLARRLLDHARTATNVVTVHAGTDDAGRFWQAVGFRPLVREAYTHIFEFA